MSLDPSTLFTIAISVTGLLGLLLLVVWSQERSIRALAWWGAAYLMGASAVTLWVSQDGALPIAPELPNALLFIACGVIWNGARLFHGRDILPGALFAGAVVWIGAMQFDAFGSSGHARVDLSSLVIASYAFLTAFELRRDRRRPLTSRWLSTGVPLLHGVVFLSPIALVEVAPGDASDGWFALFALETLLYVVGTAFVVVVMAKERIALFHKTAAMTDPLTGLFNRRAFHEAAQSLMTQQNKRRAPISLLAFDLDKFKSINDRFGHAVGDDALKVFSAAALRSMRATDVLGRLGGEEFAAILPGGPSEAAIVAERVRSAFEAVGVEISGHRIGATVSIGIASAMPQVTIASLLERSDAALYRAKENGRNRIEIADEDAASPLPVAASPKAGQSRPEPSREAAPVWAHT